LRIKRLKTDFEEEFREFLNINLSKNLLARRLYYKNLEKKTLKYNG